MCVFLCEFYSFLVVRGICTKVCVFVLNVCPVVKCVHIGETFEPTIPMGSHGTENHTWVNTF